jgi:glycosyltransferase involved in cell wall biosynthesis
LTRSGEAATGPDVSVVIPTRDRWHLLSRTLPCVQRQQGLSLEIVVVDDGSADGTAQKARTLDDPRILVVRHEQSLGLPAARNAGVRASTGQWIAFLDDDDLWSQTKLISQLRAARRAEADWCYSGAVFVDECGSLLRVADPPDPRALQERLRGVNVIPAGASNVLVRAALLHRVGEFDEQLSHFADWDLWIRLAAAARPATVDEPLIAYVQHPGNMRRMESDGLVQELDRLDAKHALAGNAEPGRFAMLQWIAESQWRTGRRRAAAVTCIRLAAWNPRRFDVVWLARLVLPGRRKRIAQLRKLARSSTKSASSSSESRDRQPRQIEWLEQYQRH